MRRHYILWKFKEGTSESQIDEAFSRLEGMQGHIDGVISIRTGVNAARRNAGYTHFLEVLFEDAAAHEAYNTHPLHRQVSSTYTQPILERVVALDFDEPAN